MNDEFIVGLDEDVKSLVSKLTEEDGKHTAILAIAGMGGSGKTTLARKIYNHQHIKAQFQNRAWVCVSQEWDTTHLLRDICKQVGVQLPPDRTLVPDAELQDLLLGTSCLLIFDDVWRREALHELLPLLLSEGSSRADCRVLVTTQNEDVLNSMGGVYIHKARCLSPEESWDLFSKIVCNKWQGMRSFDDEGEFAKLGKEMLERCHGLPLAIVALAGLLSTKGSLQDWYILKDNVSSVLMMQNKGFLDYGPVKYMLELSYSDLPYYLKPCFIYLGIFPRDECIYVDELTQLWIGEGLLSKNLCREGETLEELGTDFLNQLVQRNMVQVVQEEMFEVAQVHDLMRELCIINAMESRFFEIVSPSTESCASSRAILHSRDMAGIYNSNLRSLICFKGYSIPAREMKLLRVLHLVNVDDLGNSIENIGRMTLLRYLRIENCYGFNQLPRSIKGLEKLLVFIFDGDLDAEEGIPNNMVENMRQLRHFSLTGKVTLSPNIGLSLLMELQTIRVSAGEWIMKESSFESDHLRELKLEGINSINQLEAAYDLVRNLKGELNELSLTLKHGSGLEYDLEKMRSERFSMNLYLEGKIKKQQPSFFFFPCISKLELDHTKIAEEETFKIALAELRQLRYLMLSWGSYLADKLTLAGLPQLQDLYLGNLPDLKEWRIEEGSLPVLRKLEIFDCYQLERIPTGISNIHTLQSFEAAYISESFCNRLQRPVENEDGCVGGSSQGEDFHLIQHIPSIFVSTSYN